ncbi:MAG: hypothetical protein L3J05_10190 [Robiginitomaculum sp.]|nr:hypothetical protein [Robiginitomaculum sp.]
MGRFDLSDEEWRIIAPLLPRGTRGSRRKPADDRRVLLYSSHRRTVC